MAVKMVVGLTVVVLLLLVSSAASQVSDDKLIVPGQRIGKWTLTTTVDQLLQANGPAESGHILASDVQSDVRGLFWISQSGLVAGTRDGQTVLFLAILRSDYATDKGAKPGLERKVVETMYGQPTAVLSTNLGLALIYDEIGLRFLFNARGQVWGVEIFRPGTAKTIWRF